MRKFMMAGALVAALGAAAGSGVASAAEVEVRMLHRGATGMMVFEPALVRIAPGDTVNSVAVDKGHNVESIDGMEPEGAELFAGPFETLESTRTAAK